MIQHLVMRTWRSVSWIALISLLVASAGACVRVLPFFTARDVPFAASFVFLYAALIASTEASLIIALPFGLALEIARWSNDGTVTTLRTLGVGPFRQSANSIPVSVAISVAIGLIAMDASVLAASPGKLSNDLLAASAKDVCGNESSRRVPIVPAAWVCVRGEPVLVGWLPAGGSPKIAWKASSARFAENLESVEFENAVVVDESSSTVRTNHLILTGFAPSVLPDSVPPRERAWAAALCSCVSGLTTALALLRWPSASRTRAIGVAIAAILPFFVVAGPLLVHLSWWGLAPLLGVVLACPLSMSRLTSRI